MQYSQADHSSITIAAFRAAFPKMAAALDVLRRQQRDESERAAGASRRPLPGFTPRPVTRGESIDHKNHQRLLLPHGVVLVDFTGDHV